MPSPQSFRLAKGDSAAHQAWDAATVPGLRLWPCVGPVAWQFSWRSGLALMARGAQQWRGQLRSGGAGVHQIWLTAPAI